MRKPKLHPCKVPWMLHPTGASVTLSHTETDVEPKCTVTFVGARLKDDGYLDTRRIELVFKLCWHVRVAPKSDMSDLSEEGFDVSVAHPSEPEKRSWETIKRIWRESGTCPVPGFYTVADSEWIKGFPSGYIDYIGGLNHFVVGGRNGYLELIAQSYSWREWIWSEGHIDDAPNKGPVVDEGNSLAP